MTWFLDKEMLESFDISAYDPAVIAELSGVTLEQARACVDPDRVYWVQTSDYGFVAGADGEGRPCLMFVGAPRLGSAVEEDLNFLSIDMPTRQLFTASTGIDLSDCSWDDIFDAATNAVGYVHVGNCPMKAFVYPGVWHYAITPFSFVDHEYIMGGEYDEEQARMLHDWIVSGNYVLQCGNAYYMNSEGEVESS